MSTMFNNISKKKNNSGKDFLQKELEFYTNLLAQHKKQDNFLPCTSSSTFFAQCSYSMCSKYSEENVNEMRKPSLNIKENHQKKKDYIYPQIPLVQAPKTTIPNSLTSSKMIFSKQHVKNSIFPSKVINSSQLDKSNNPSVMYDTKKLVKSNSEISSELLINQKFSKKSDSKTLMGEIAAVTEQLKIMSRHNDSSRFKKINSLAKVERKEKKYLQNRKQISNKNNSFSNMNEENSQAVASGMGNFNNPKLPYAKNNVHCLKRNLKSHSALLEKLNAVKKFFNATTKHSTKVLNKARKNLLERKNKCNYNCKQEFVKFSDAQKNHTSAKFNQFSELKFLSVSKENKHFPQVSNPTQAQCKAVNDSNQPKRLSTNSLNSKVILDNYISATVLKNYAVGNDRFKPRICRKRTFVGSVHSQNNFSLLKKSPNIISKKYSPHFFRSVIKHRQNPTLNKSYKLSKSLLENVMKSPDSSGVDVDLLLELAAENKKKLSSSFVRKRLYKSKSRLINSYSLQIKTAKMIKTKYFNPYRKFTDSKNQLCPNKSFKGYRSYYESNISKSSKSFLPKNKYRKCHQKKIVDLGMKSIKTSSHRKSFKEKPAIKSLSPVSIMIANRALNRSISQALSASTRKKMQKINTYCMFYNRFGRCNKGIKCAFVHDPSKIAVCTRFLRGTCKSEKCLFSHEINPGKMAICSFFLQNACTKGNCPYLHEKLSSDAELCKAFVQGYCPNGKNCKKAHILICSKFLRGQCDKGKYCISPHPVKKEIIINSVEEKDEFQLETVLRYFESNPQESLSLVVPSRVKSIPQQQDFISLEKSAT